MIRDLPSRGANQVQNGFRIGESHHVAPSLNRVTGSQGSARLEPKVMQVLVYLAEHAGQVVSKHELMAAVWADTAVTDDVLTRAISELRRLFDDDAKHPRVIETIPKGGYRLIAAVGLPERDESRSPSSAGLPRRGRRSVVAALLAAMFIGGAAGLWVLWRAGTDDAGTRPAPRLVQLTAFEGLERSPTFSPDGTQIAFSWNGEHEDNFDIYVRLVGASEIRRVTTDPAPDVNPAWSPDGRLIAFVRERPAERGGSTVQVISPLGGVDRKLSALRVQGPVSWSPETSSIAWTPDGRWVAVSLEPAVTGPADDTRGIHLISAADGTARPLTRATSPARHVAPGFSSDGRRFAYVSCAASVTVGAPSCDVFAADFRADDVLAGPPRRVTFQGLAIQGLAWSSDGASIVYDTAGRGPFYLWTVLADGSSPPERLEVAGMGSRKPATAGTRDLLVFERRLVAHGVYRLKGDDPPEPVLVSSVFDYDPQFSPDGRRLVFASRRSGDALDLWVASADGSHPQQVSHGPGPRQDSPQWSPDGQRIAFASLREDGHWDIWVMNVDGGAPRRLTTDPGDEKAPTWSRDGRRIYFSSDRGGGRDIWWTPAAGGSVERVTHGGGGSVAYESPDGRDIVYQTSASDSPLVAQPLTGGPRRELVPCVRSQAFTVGAGAVYYSPCASGPDATVHRLDVATGEDGIRGRVRVPFEVANLAVSPDGRTILVARATEAGDLMLIEHFR